MAKKDQPTAPVKDKKTRSAFRDGLRSTAASTLFCIVLPVAGFFGIAAYSDDPLSSPVKGGHGTGVERVLKQTGQEISHGKSKKAVQFGPIHAVPMNEATYYLASQLKREAEKKSANKASQTKRQTTPSP